MDKELPNRQILIKYLLGELSGEERAAISQSYFEDDDCFEELLDVENELLDSYAHGSLNESQRQAFKQYLEKLPDGQQKEAVAKAFTQLSDKEKAQAQQTTNHDVPAPVSLWKSWLPLPAKSRLIGQSLLLTSLLIMAIGFGILWFQTRQLGNDNEQLRTALTNLERDNEALEQNRRNLQADANSEHLRQLEEQLKLEQQVNEAQAQQLASLQPAMPVVVSWLLTNTLRSGNSPDQVTLPRHAKFVSITMPIENQEKMAGYRAILQTATGEQYSEHSGLRVNKTGKAVSLKLPANYFTETSYKITLIETAADAAELARDFYFTVTIR